MSGENGKDSNEKAVFAAAGCWFMNSCILFYSLNGNILISAKLSKMKKKIMEKNHFLDFKNLVADAKSSMSGWGYNSVQRFLLSRHKTLCLILWTEKSKK